MKVTCPDCGWSAEVPEEKIPDGGVTATCRKCQSKFEVKKELKPDIGQPPVSPPTPQRDTKPCPLCGEEILFIAKKCKHCGSMLDEVREEEPPPVQEPSKTAEPIENAPDTASKKPGAAPKKSRALLLFSILILMTLIQVFFIMSKSTNSTQSVAPVQTRPTDEALGKIKDVVKSKKTEYDNKKYSETLCAERFRPGSEDYKDCVYSLEKDMNQKFK